MAPVLFSRYIWKWRAKRIRRWRRTGKTTLMGSSSLCVVTVYYHSLIYVNPRVIDRIILCCCCVVDLGGNPGPPAKPAGHVQLLPRKYVSGHDQSECIEFTPYFPTPVHSTKLCSLGECALVPEFGHQHYLRPTRNVVTAVGATIPQGHPATIQSAQASSDPCVLF